MQPALNPEQKQKILDISRDFYRYADNNLWIKDKDGSIVKFIPNKAQRALIDRVLQLLEEGKPIRIIVLKARQMGLSTAIEAIIYWWTATHSNITSMIIGHEDASSKNLYRMFRRYYDNCNPVFQPSVFYDTKTDLTFANRNGGGLNSVIKTATAKNVSAGRSDTIQLLHGSEIGEWERGEELVASLLQTVPVRPNTMIFLESTANGIGNYFHKEWKEAKKGTGSFEPFFFPWWIHDEYEMEPQGGKYTPEEEEIVTLMREGIKVGPDRYKVPEDRIPYKIAFRRYKEREFRSDPRKLYQEYPSTDQEAFLGSGRPRFDIPSLMHMERLCDNFEPAYYELVDTPDRNVTANKVEVASKTRAEVAGLPFKVWDLPKPGEEYVIGADVAEGLKDGDYSVADVIRKSDLKTVARWHGHCDPDVFGRILDQIGRFYNYALLGVEINNHGLAVVQRLRDLFYTNLYRREKGFDERFEESTAKLGWKTDLRSKPLMIDYLAEAIRERLITDYDITFVEEAMSYVVDDNGRTNAEEGNFDDCVIAKAIALQMFEWSNNNKANLKVYKPKKISARKRAHKVIK
jgi:hypothetical protein